MWDYEQQRRHSAALWKMWFKTPFCCAYHFRSMKGSVSLVGKYCQLCVSSCCSSLLSPTLGYSTAPNCADSLIRFYSAKCAIVIAPAAFQRLRGTRTMVSGNVDDPKSASLSFSYSRTETIDCSTLLTQKTKYRNGKKMCSFHCRVGFVCHSERCVHPEVSVRLQCRVTSLDRHNWQPFTLRHIHGRIIKYVCWMSNVCAKCDLQHSLALIYTHRNRKRNWNGPSQDLPLKM